MLAFFICESFRAALRKYLLNSGSLGVRFILKWRDLSRTGRFVRAVVIPEFRVQSSGHDRVG